MSQPPISVPAVKARVARAMLPRGAACDLCRTRKVKCDGLRPVCNQCTKAARGSTDHVTTCIYEGPTLQKSTANTRKRNNPPLLSATNVTVTIKRDREDPPFIPNVQEDSTARKRYAGTNQRVEVLVDRISELERRLRENQPTSQLHTHIRPFPSPPFYPNAYLPHHDPTSVPMDGNRDSASRRSLSFGESDTRSAEYASFVPPLPSIDGFDEAGVADFEFTPMRQPSNEFTGYAPITYSPGLALHPNSLGVTSLGSCRTIPLPQPIPRRDSEDQTSSLAESPTDLPIDSSLFQIFYPAWPPSLPQPTIVNHLISIFFRRAIVPSSFINQSRLLAALLLPPSHPEFPHPALIHAICAFACVFVSKDTLGFEGIGRRKYWETETHPRDYHFKCAREEIDIAVVTMSKNLFQVLQAVILCCYICYACASFTELWLLSGTATRLCTPLGLNHLAPWTGQMTVEPQTVRGSISILLGPPRDREEHYERVATFWAAFSIDRHASASTDWSTSIDELDISTQLPCYSPASESSLSIRHPNFIHEFAQPVGSLGLYVKAVVLLGRVINFLQRLPRTAGIDARSRIEEQRAIKASAAFLELDYALAKFRTATSSNVFDAGDSIDGHLASAYAIPHAATILLHETFCERNDRSPISSIARCLTSAKCVVNSTYLLYESSNDLSGCDPFLPFCWSVVGRALVRDYAIKISWGEEKSAAISKQLAEHCIGFTSRCAKIRGTQIAHVLTSNLKQLLNDPASTFAQME